MRQRTGARCDDASHEAQPRLCAGAREWRGGASCTALVLTAALGGCGGEQAALQRAAAADSAGAARARGVVATATVSAPSAGTVSGSASGSASGGGEITPQLISLGDSIFHGRAAGGTCQNCHGQDAKGTSMAPNLADTEWHNGDGSFQFIIRTVTTGVPQPMKFPGPMPPKGGAPLSIAQVRAVAAYVFSLSHPAS